MPTAPSRARSALRRNSTPPARSNGRSTGRPRSTASSSPIATPCPRPKAARMRPGSGPPILKGIRAYGELVNNRKAEDITRDDLITGGCAMVSCFIREPEFVGQTKDRLATTDAQRLGRRRGARPFRQLAGRRYQIGGRDPRFPRAARRRTPAPPSGKGNRPQDRHQETAPARQADRLLCHRRAREPSFSSSKAIPPAAPPKWPANARRRPCCRCAARS